jgi:hypothetical protein
MAFDEQRIILLDKNELALVREKRIGFGTSAIYT